MFQLLQILHALWNNTWMTDVAMHQVIRHKTQFITTFAEMLISML